MEMSPYRLRTASQAGDCRLGDDGLDGCGDKLEQQTPGAGTGQAASAQRGESSNASTSGSSNKIIRRWASR